MESRIFPTWEQLEQQHQKLTDGERALLKYLDKYLPRDNNWTPKTSLSDYKGWLIFAQPYLNGTRPDIIVFNPFVGVMIYEVKDWDLSHYKLEKKGNYNKWHVYANKRFREIKNPVSQVNHYKEKIIGQLVPIIGERVDKEKRTYGLIKTAVYFHLENTDSLKDFFNYDKDDNRKKDLVFGSDLLNSPQNISELLPDVKWAKSKYWDRTWNNELLFWFKPPYHSIEQGTVLTLKASQKKLAEPEPGHHRARGVAGSGKTQALAYRAAKLASMNKNVLILSFNITLWHYVKDMVARAPFGFNWRYITFNHFHGFCKDVLNDLGYKWPKSPDRVKFSSNEQYELALEAFFRETVPNHLISAVQNSDGFFNYDAILIDEGQDYYVDWYSMLHNYFLNTRDELLVVVDKKQNIYERQLEWIDKRSRNDELGKFKQDIIQLTKTWRLPERVAKLANEFSIEFDLDQELKVDIDSQQLQALYMDHIVWRNIDEKKWIQWIDNAYEVIKKNKQSASDIVILLPNHKKGMECVKYFNSKNIEVNHVFEDDEEKRYHPHKKAFWMGDGRLKISTIHSFKGWELMNIIIFIPSRAPESNKKLDSILYTAITRTKMNLVIFNAHTRYNQFGKKLPFKWGEQTVF